MEIKERIPRSERKRRRKEEYRIRRRERRPEVRRRRRLLKQKERNEMMALMSSEERESFIETERKNRVELSRAMELFLDDVYNNGTTICINCSFDHCMDNREIRSLAKQISLSYNLIKKHKAPVKLVLSSFNKDSKLYKDCNLFGIENWKIHQHAESYWDLFDSKDIVVLTPDSSDVLEEVQNDKVYIIGGLVDRHVKKNETLVQGETHGIACKSLPIKKYVPSCKRVVLNVLTVFEILIYKINNLTWEETFNKCLPTRNFN